MNINEELYYPLAKDEFDIQDVCGIFQKLISEYNRIIKNNDIDESDLSFAVRKIIIYVKGQTNLNEISQAMLILLLALEKREKVRTAWVYFATVSFNSGDLEICRELVISEIKNHL